MNRINTKILYIASELNKANSLHKFIKIYSYIKNNNHLLKYNIPNKNYDIIDLIIDSPYVEYCQELIQILFNMNKKKKLNKIYFLRIIDKHTNKFYETNLRTKFKYKNKSYNSISYDRDNLLYGIHKYVNLNTKNNKGRTVIFYTCSHLLYYLLDNFKFDLTITDSMGLTFLEFHSLQLKNTIPWYKYHKKIQKYLNTRKDNFMINISQNYLLFTTLIKTFNLNKIKLSIEFAKVIINYENKFIIEFINYKLITPELLILIFQKSYIYNKINVFSTIFYDLCNKENGQYYINFIDEKGNTLMHYFCTFHQTQFIRYLLLKFPKIEYNENKNGKTPHQLYLNNKIETLLLNNLEQGLM